MGFDLPGVVTGESSGSSRSIEAAWEELWSQLMLSEGFWLGFLFGTDLRAILELECRAV
jgi:hypothetical protein